MFSLTLTLLAVTWGFFILSTGQSFLVWSYFVLSYFILFLTLRRAIRYWNDPFNPLVMMVLLGIIHFSTPAFLLLTRIEPKINLFELMGLDTLDWVLGHVLALTAVLSAVFGWHLLPASMYAEAIPDSVFRFPPGTKYAAVIGFLIGFISLIVFILANAGSVFQVALSGTFRSLEIQEGTGKLWYLSLMLISSSVIMCTCILSKNRPVWIALIPPVFAMMCFWILGGRTRAITPIGAALLTLWWKNQKRWRDTPFRLSVLIGVCIFSLIVLLYLGSLYRGGYGIFSLTLLSLSNLWEYLKYSIFVEIGRLHPLAGGISIGPGVLGWQTFMSHLMWPLNEFMALPGKSTGVFIAESFGLITADKWGFLPTLIGDAYLKLGLLGVVAVSILFGLGIKILYSRFRAGRVNVAFYSLATIYSFRIFFESIEKWGEALTVLVFAGFLILLGKIFFSNFIYK